MSRAPRRAPSPAVGAAQRRAQSGLPSAASGLPSAASGLPSTRVVTRFLHIWEWMTKERFYEYMATDFNILDRSVVDLKWEGMLHTHETWQNMLGELIVRVTIRYEQQLMTVDAIRLPLQLGDHT